MVLIHENAHILSLSASQSDNDLIGWEEIIVDGDWDEYDKAKAEIEKKDKKIIWLNEKLEQLDGDIATIKKQIVVMRNDSVQNGKAINSLQRLYDDLSSAYDLLASKNSRNMAEKAKETKGCRRRANRPARPHGAFRGP